jgi:hypothetical protein
MAEDTTTTNTTQQVAMSLAQPNSRLHALPQELQEMIFSFVVISPNPIPARVHLRDIETFSDDDDDDDSTNSNASESDNSPTNFATRVKITPSQPALSRIDRQTRPAVLRLFSTECNYAPEARLVRRVMLEMSVAKTCGVQPQPRLLVSSRLRGRREPQQHLYRVLVCERSGDEGVCVRFGADLAVMCSCAMRMAGLIRPALAERRRYLQDEREISSALDFAQDVERDIVLGNECQYHFCHEKSSTKCRDCGLRVHRQEPLGAYLLERVRREVAEVAERQRREAERQRRAAEREAARLARERELAEWRARLDAEAAERAAVLEAAAAERAARIDAERTERATRRAEAAEDAAKALAYLKALNEDIQEKRQPRSRDGCLVM